MNLRTNNDYVPTQHKVINFYIKQIESICFAEWAGP